MDAKESKAANAAIGMEAKRRKISPKQLLEQQEKDSAIATLKEILKPGDTVYTILRHCSRSGMYRRISLMATDKDGGLRSLDWLAEKAGLAKSKDRESGLVVGGCGMDMGFHLVYGLGRSLWPDGYVCAGDGGESRKGRCRSNDHSNGDRDYTAHQHRDGGYALRHEWI